jgi:hypothetical protein
MISFTKFLFMNLHSTVIPSSPKPFHVSTGILSGHVAFPLFMFLKVHSISCLVISPTSPLFGYVGEIKFKKNSF